MLRLNSVSQVLLNKVDTQDTVLKVNNGDKVVSLSRNSIVLSGRRVAMEYMGTYVNSTNSKEKYVSRLNGMTDSKGNQVDYATLSKAHTEKKLLFCAAKVCAATGETPPATFDDFKRNHARFATDRDFLKVLAAIDRDVLEPIYFDVLNDVGMGLMQWEAIPFGGTKEIVIKSNDVFVIEDSAWGSGKSTTKNYLYAKSLTLNPTMYSCNATIKWYQDVVTGDAGRYYAAIINGLYSKIYAKLIRTLNAAIDTTTGNIPAGLTADTYDTQNWLTITDKLAAANGVRVDNLMAIGTRSALSHLLPVDGQGGAIVGLQYGLGKEWFENGFLPNAGGVDLFPVSPVIVPGTQNSTLDTIDTGDNIFVLAKAGLGYAPMYGGYYEGTPITLTATPGGYANSQGTADFTIDINFGATMDIKPVFASKVAVIKSVYPTPTPGN